MNCPRCGAILTPDSHQCDRCGLLFGTLEGPRTGSPSRPRGNGAGPGLSPGASGAGQWTMPALPENAGTPSRPSGYGTGPGNTPLPSSGQWPMSPPVASRQWPAGPPPAPSGQWPAGQTPATGQWPIGSAPTASGHWPTGSAPTASGQWPTGAAPSLASPSRPRLSLPDVAGPSSHPRAANDLHNGVFAGAALQQGRLRVLSAFGPLHRQLPGLSLWIASDSGRRGDRVVVMELPFAGLTPPEAGKLREMMTIRLEALSQHPAFPRLLGAFAEQSRHFLIFEYLEGEFLSDRVQRIGALPERLVLAYGEQLLEGLQFLEQQSPPAVHGMICPETVLISRDGRAAHFALWSPHVIARSLSPAFPEPPPLSGYRAPELQRGQMEPRADLYSLGATLFTAITGSDAEKRSAGIFPPARSLNPQVSAPADVVLAKAVRLIPSQRYQHANEMLLDFSRAERGESPTRDTLSQMEPIFSVRRLRGAALGVSGIVALLLIAALIFTLVGRASTTAPQAVSTPIPTVTVNPTIQALAAKDEGISTGQFVFDTADRAASPTDTSDMHTPSGAIAAEQAGAVALHANNISTALDDFQQAVVDDPSNPEARIYLANTRVLAAKLPFVTLEVAVVFDATDQQTSRQVLRGVALAQSIFNNDSILPGNDRVMIEIVSLGPSAEAASDISKFYAQQLALGNPSHSLGVISWAPKNVTQATLQQLNASITTLTAAKVPIVVPLTTVDEVQPSPYLFRLSPPNSAQGIALATEVLTRSYFGGAVVVAIDKANFTDQEIGQYAYGALQKTLGQGAVGPLTFDSSAADHGAADLAAIAKKAAYYGAANIVFLGDGDGVAGLIKSLLAQPPYTTANLPTITAAATADDPALLGIGASPTAQFAAAHQAAMLHVNVLGLADPGEWDYLASHNVMTAGTPDFFANYGNTFTPPNVALPLPPDAFAILSYDAVRLMITPLVNANIWTAAHLPTPADEQSTLAKVQNNTPFQGVGGRIAFDANGLPVNRSMALKSIAYDTATSASGQKLLRWLVVALVNGPNGFCNLSQQCLPS